MPYIKKEDRLRYEALIREIASLVPPERESRPGHLNYIISSLLHSVFEGKMRYADHNEVIGVLHCAADEFYRRKTAPYEDEKIREEGDLE